MKQSESDEAQQADARIKDDYTSFGRHDPMEFRQRRSRKLQVMKYIE